MDKKFYPIIYYDSQCSFCTRTKSLVSKLDDKGMNFEPLSPNLINSFQNLLALDHKTATNVMFYINKAEAVFYGSEAIFAYLRDKKSFLHAIGIIGTKWPLNWFCRYFYSFVAVNRLKLSFFIR